MISGRLPSKDFEELLATMACLARAQGEANDIVGSNWDGRTCIRLDSPSARERALVPELESAELGAGANQAV